MFKEFDHTRGLPLKLSYLFIVIFWSYNRIYGYGREIVFVVLREFF